MFLWNMLGALMLLPALAYFLLPQEKLAKTEAGEPAASHG
jgi:Na+/phosphate symporter